MGKKRVERTRNGGTWTEAQYWSHLRSKLRQAYRYWKPMQQALEDAKRPYTGNDKRIKWEYQCNKCKGWFKRKDVERDHVIPAGTLKCPEDIVPFIEKLTPEDPSAYQCLCKPCHKEKTDKENEDRRNK